ncbi:MAG: hypothetical protein AAF843_15460 [Bacteroidota bacterium]
MSSNTERPISKKLEEKLVELQGKLKETYDEITMLSKSTVVKVLLSNEVKDGVPIKFSFELTEKENEKKGSKTASNAEEKNKSVTAKSKSIDEFLNRLDTRLKDQYKITIDSSNLESRLKAMNEIIEKRVEKIYKSVEKTTEDIKTVQELQSDLINNQSAKNFSLITAGLLIVAAIANYIFLIVKSPFSQQLDDKYLPGVLSVTYILLVMSIIMPIAVYFIERLNLSRKLNK